MSTLGVKRLHFHGEDVEPSSSEEALFHVISAPLEESVSYGTGTSLGPMEILKASAQLELYDGKSVPADCGIYTADIATGNGIEGVDLSLRAIDEAVTKAITCKSLPVLLGGEHTVSLGAIRALHRTGERFGVIHFDAHADLRDTYEGSKLSHACVMRRVVDLGIPIVQIGTRSYSLEEQQFRAEKGICYYDAETICRDGLDVVRVPEDFPERIYLSFDVDAIDSAIFPATGTPVPGGLSWYQCMWLFERLLGRHVCLGYDVVEFAPIEGLHSCSFAVAQLVYNLMGYVSRSTVNKRHWRTKISLSTFDD